MSSDNHWREGEFRAKTVVDEIAVEETINRYSGRCPLLEDAVNSLRWRLARRHRAKNPIPVLRRVEEYKEKDCFLAKVEMETPSGYINVLFAEDEDEITLIDIEVIVTDADNPSVAQPLFKNKS